jgi:hypothetical protein
MKTPEGNRTGFTPYLLQILYRQQIFFKEQKKILDIWDSSNSSKGAIQIIRSLQTTGERTGLAAGTSLYKKHVLKNWFVYIILSKTT